jgi:hypothetical protein
MLFVLGSMAQAVLRYHVIIVSGLLAQPLESAFRANAVDVPSLIL